MGGIMFWTVEQSAFYLRMEHHQVYYLLAMGYIEAVKTGPKLWRIVPEAVEDYAKRHPQTKAGKTAGYFIYKGNGGLLFDSLPDRVPHDPERGTAGVEGRGRPLVYPAGRHQKILLPEIKPLRQLDLFTA
jgi:excisionase family DNA binding protein